MFLSGDYPEILPIGHRVRTLDGLLKEKINVAGNSGSDQGAICGN